MQKLGNNYFVRAAALTLSMASSALMSSCTSPTGPDEPKPEPKYTLEQNAHELDTSRATEYNQETGEIILSDTQGLQVGDVISTLNSPVTPQGFIGEIESINNNTITTSPATIDDLIENCDLSISFRVTPADKRFAGKDGFDFNLDLVNYIFYDKDGDLNTTDDQAKLNGNISFNVDVTDLSLVIKDPIGIEYFNFATVTQENLILTLGSDVPIEIIKECKLHPDIYCTPVAVGPLVAVPVIELNGKLEGIVSVSEVGISQTATLEAGISYTDGNWDATANLSNNFDYNLSRFLEHAEFKVGVEPKAKILFYGLAGAALGVEGYARAEVNPTQTPWWSVFVGLNANISATLGVLGFEIAEYTTEIANLELLVAQAELDENRPPYTPRLPNPSDGQTNVPINTTLRCWSGDPDEDTLSYIFHITTPTNPDSTIASENPRTDLTNLKYSTNYNWYVSVSDGEFTTTSPTWTFRTKAKPQIDDLLIFSSNTPTREQFDLFTATLDGSRTSLFLHLPDSDERNASVSPDGRTIAVESNINGLEGIYLIDRNELDGSANEESIRYLVAGGNPCWSPDGNTIGYLYYDVTNPSNLHVIDKDGTNDRVVGHRLGIVPMHANSPTWINNDEIAFGWATSPQAYMDIYKVDISTNATTQLTSDVIHYNDPDLSPDASRIVARGYTTGKHLLYTMNIDGSDITQIPTATESNLNPCWAPDGKGVYYVRPEYNYDNSIWYVSLDGNTERNIVNLTGSNIDPEILYNIK